MLKKGCGNAALLVWGLDMREDKTANQMNNPGGSGGRSFRGFRVFLVLLLVCVMGFIFFMSSRNVDQSMDDSIGFDRILASWFVDGFDEMTPDEQFAAAVAFDEPIRHVAHTLEFFMLGLLAGAFCKAMRLKAWPAFALAGGLLYGILDEIHQIFVYGRGCQISDMGFDALGAALGVAAVAAVIKKRSHR